MFCRPGCAVKENQLLVINNALSIDQGGIETVVNFILVIVMFQGSGKKLANPVNRMIFPRHRVSLVVEQSRQGFADSVVAQAYREPPRHPGNDSALDKPLGIDDKIISLCLKRFLESPHLTVQGSTPQVAPPPANGDRDNPINGRMPGRDIYKVFFNNPIEGKAPVGPMGVGHCRQGVDNISEGRHFDNKHTHRNLAL